MREQLLPIASSLLVTVLVARKPVTDTVLNIKSVVEQCFDYCTAITIWNHTEQSDVLSSDFGGVSEYLVQISELEHDSSTDRHFFVPSRPVLQSVVKLSSREHE